ncbi:MAG: 3-deoxy-8-phosphooctulonate synthase [Saprospiraceae bacterium]|nr:3-deoxy-8-phosphooctulonate synthase [Saprospiraceae bacterium]
MPRLKHINSRHFLLLAGPCVIEDDQTPFEIAGEINRICEVLQIPFVFKASYRKANRSRRDSFTGIGDETALRILAEIADRYQIPVITDIHSEDEAKFAADFVDILQIPAFLCRQTSLLEAAALTEKFVNIKKGQFLSPEAMKFAVDKVKALGNERVMITERGTSFGYQDLVVDFRGFPVMRSFAPLILDCTHSLQRPNQSEGVTGGQPELIGTIARAGVAAGLDGLFIETHPTPAKALSDGANMLPLDQLSSLLTNLLAIESATSSRDSYDL